MANHKQYARDNAPFGAVFNAPLAHLPDKALAQTHGKTASLELAVL